MLLANLGDGELLATSLSMKGSFTSILAGDLRGSQVASIRREASAAGAVDSRQSCRCRMRQLRYRGQRRSARTLCRSNSCW